MFLPFEISTIGQITGAEFSNTTEKARKEKNDGRRYSNQ
jgi:hypothetical protein